MPVCDIELQWDDARPIERDHWLQERRVAGRGIDAPGAPVQQAFDKCAPKTTVCTCDQSNSVRNIHGFLHLIQVVAHAPTKGVYLYPRRRAITFVKERAGV